MEEIYQVYILNFTKSKKKDIFIGETNNPYFIHNKNFWKKIAEKNKNIFFEEFKVKRIEEEVKK